MKTKNAQSPKEAIPQIDTSFLLSKVDQSTSVRSTFTLTPDADKILDALAQQANITQREIFDQAVSKGWVKLFAEMLKGKKTNLERSVRRTLVLSGNALDQLDTVSREAGIKRDDLAYMVITKFLLAYNTRLTNLINEWGKIGPIVQQAIFMVDDTPAMKFIDQNTPTEHRENIKAWVGGLIHKALTLSGEEAMFSPPWEENDLYDLYMIHRSLVPVKVEGINL